MIDSTEMIDYAALFYYTCLPENPCRPVVSAKIFDKGMEERSSKSVIKKEDQR